MNSFIFFTEESRMNYNQNSNCDLRVNRYGYSQLTKEVCEEVFNKLNHYQIGETLSFYVNKNNEIINEKRSDGPSMQIADIMNVEQAVDLEYDPKSYPVSDSKGISGSMNINMEGYDISLLILISDDRLYFSINGETGKTELFKGVLRYNIQRKNENNITIINLEEIVDQSSYVSFSTAAALLLPIVGCRVKANQEYHKNELEEVCSPAKQFFDQMQSNYTFFKIDENSKKVFNGSVATYNPVSAIKNNFYEDGI